MLLVFTSTKNIHIKEGNKQTLFFHYILKSSFTPRPYLLSLPTAQNSTLGPGLVHKKEGLLPRVFSTLQSSRGPNAAPKQVNWEKTDYGFVHDEIRLS